MIFKYFFPSTVIERNKIDKNIQKLEVLNILKKVFQNYTAITKQSL